MTDQSLPSLELVEGEFYWVTPAYGKHADSWIVAHWQVGYFWSGTDEVPPRLIVGPIPRPPPSDAGGAG